jgi:hypothetical protein
MTKTNGRIIGPYQTVSILSAGGVHDSFDQYNYKLLGEWVYSPTVEVSLSTTSLNETTNKDLVVTLNTTGYASGTQFSVEAVNVSNFSSSDMNPYNGTVTVSGNEASATGNTTLSVVQDGTDETPDTETFKVEVRGPTPSTTLVATSSNVTISDSSTAPSSLSVSFYESAYGASIGQVNVYFVPMNSAGTAVGGSITSVYQRSAGSNADGSWSLKSGSGYPTYSAGTKYRVAWLHTKTNSGFTGDYAIDDVTITGTFNNLGSGTGWLSPNSASTFSNVADAFLISQQVPTTTTASRGRWNRDSGSTPSSSTGPSADNTTGGGYFFYTEASSPNTTVPTYFWLFSPEFTA